MTPVRLSPLDALIEAVVRIGQRRSALLRAAGVPLGAMVLATGAGSLVTGGAQVVLQLSSVALLALTAAHVHRVLCPAQPSPAQPSPAQPVPGSIPLRIWLRYLVSLLTFVIGLGISVSGPLTWIADHAWSGGAPSTARLNGYLAVAFAIVAVGIYLGARLCLALPAVALQRPQVLRLAWHCSRGNAAALAVLLLLPERLHWVAARALGDDVAGSLLSALVEALVLVAIAAPLSVAWSRLVEPVQASAEPRSGASRLSLAAAVPASSATLLLAAPLLLSHIWTQAEGYQRLLALRDETVLLERAGVASERQHSASLAVIGGDRARGLELYREALELYRGASNPSGEARTLALIGALERDLGHEPEARAAFENALERARASGEASIEEHVQKVLSTAQPAALP
jgi:tetratricopeptide (TPR) repeat protein